MKSPGARVGRSTTCSCICRRSSPSAWSDGSRHAEADDLFQIALADRVRLFGCSVCIGHGIELDDCPAAELHLAQRREHGRQVDRPTSELDELVWPATRASFGHAHVLDMEEEQTLGVAANCRGGVAGADLIV